MKNRPLILVLCILGIAFCGAAVLNAPAIARAKTVTTFDDLTALHEAYLLRRRSSTPNGIAFSLHIDREPDTNSSPKLPPLTHDETAELLTPLLSGFDSLNNTHLAPCQNYEAYDRTAKIKTMLAVSAPDAQTLTPMQALLQSVHDLTGTAFTIEDITVFAEAEISALHAEYEALERGVIKQGLAADLESYAADPMHYRTDSQTIAHEYALLLAELETVFGASLYAYDTPKAGVEVVTHTHPWNAVASYQKNKMVLYFNTAAYDAKDYAFLAVHEIMPGHHLETSARRKAPICPAYKTRKARRLMEGWATYAETLADEVDFFDAPGRRLGWLDYRMIRAVRILLDIERTQNGDSYESLVALWDARTPPRLHPLFNREYKRMIRARHHHFQYMLGAQTILSARTTLKAEMGETFDIKKFHDAILRGSYGDMKIFPEKVKAAMQSIEAPETLSH